MPTSARFVAALLVKFLSFGFGFGFDFGRRRRRASSVLPGASSSRLHLVVAAARRQLRAFAVLPLPAALVPVLHAVRRRRRREGGVDAGPHADRGRLSPHCSHGSRQMARALAVQRPHQCGDQSTVFLFPHHQIPAAVTSQLPI